MPQHAWVFPAQLVRVIDGDTIDCRIDQGMHAYRVERLRLLNVNAPEPHGATRAAGDAATAYVIAWLGQAGGDWPLRIETHKSDVFGRYLCLLWRAVDGRNLNEDLIAAGHAVPFMEVSYA